MLRAQSLVERDALDGELAKLSPGDMALVVAPPERLPHVSFEALLHLCGTRQMKAVYVSVTRPTKTVRAEFERAGVAEDQVWIIDCVSPMNPAQPHQARGALEAESPAALTDISILLEQALNELGGGNIVVHIDSIAMMLNWNSFENLAKFLVLTTAKLRTRGVMGLFVMPAHHEERLLAHVAPICDHVIQLNPGWVAPHMVPVALRATHRFLGHGGKALGRGLTSWQGGQTMDHFRGASTQVFGQLLPRLAALAGARSDGASHLPWANGPAVSWLPRPVSAFLGLPDANGTRHARPR